MITGLQEIGRSVGKLAKQYRLDIVYGIARAVLDVDHVQIHQCKSLLTQQLLVLSRWSEQFAHVCKEGYRFKF